MDCESSGGTGGEVWGQSWEVDNTGTQNHEK
jgi:hypothetical protein